jgi:hypothetical protein
MGLEAINSNIYSDSLGDNIELSDVGYLIALTGNSDINKFAINKFGKDFGENGTFRLVTSEELNDPNHKPKQGVFIQTDDFISLTETTRKYPAIHEIDLRDKAHYDNLIELSEEDRDIIPLFLKDEEGELHIIANIDKEDEEFTEGWQLAYLGKAFDVEKLKSTEPKSTEPKSEEAPN